MSVVETLEAEAGLESSLDAALDGVGVPERDSEGRFIVDDAAKADWCGRKLVKIMAKQAQIRELAAEQIEAVIAWRDGQVASLDGDRAFFEELLRRYHEGVLAEDPKAKTISLPSGELKARKQADLWDFEEARFIEWARKVCPELVRTVEEVDRVEAKRRLSPVDREVDRAPGPAVVKGTGEVAEGLYVSGAGVRFSFVPKGVSA